MPKAKLTDEAIAKFLRKTAAADAILWDESVTGLGIRKQGASARWIFQYRTAADGVTRRLSLGTVDALPLKAARQEARRKRTAVDEGQDPSAEKQQKRAADRAAKAEARAAVTLAAAVERWAAEPHPERRARTNDQYAVHLRRHVVPVLGARKLRDVTAAHVEQVRRGRSPALQNRITSAVAALMAWAEATGLRPAGPNPARGIGRAREPRRILYLTDEQQVRAWAALEDLARNPPTGRAPTGGNMRVTPGAVAALRLMGLTGLRPSEAAGLRWDEVSLERRTLEISEPEPTEGAADPLPRVKTGGRTVPLSAAAVQLLSDLHATARGRFVFPDDELTPDRPVKYARIVSVWSRVRERAELGKVPPYVLRHTVGTNLTTSGAAMPVQMAIMGHTKPEMTLRYAHATQSAVTAALDRLDAIRPLPTGAAPDSATVLEMTRPKTRRAR